MRNVFIKIMTAALASVMLAGCDTAGAPPGTPGTATVTMHGSVSTSIGVSSH